MISDRNVEMACNILQDEADRLAADDQLQRSGNLLAARQVIRGLRTELEQLRPKAAPGEPAAAPPDPNPASPVADGEPDTSDPTEAPTP